MRWIIRGWPGPSADGMGPRLALNTAGPGQLWMSGSTVGPEHKLCLHLSHQVTAKSTIGV